MDNASASSTDGAPSPSPSPAIGQSTSRPNSRGPASQKPRAPGNAGGRSNSTSEGGGGGGRGGSRAPGGPSSRGGGRRGGAPRSGPPTTTVAPPTSSGPPSEGEIKLKELISEFRNSLPPGTNSGTVQARPLSAGARGKSGPVSASPANLQIASTPPPSASASSTLNPNAGGFQPHGLGSLTEVDREVLITPLVGTFENSSSYLDAVTRPPPQQHQQRPPMPPPQPPQHDIRGPAASAPATFPGGSAFSYGQPAPAASPPQSNQTLQQLFAQLQQMQNMTAQVGQQPQILEITAALLSQIQMQLALQSEGAPPAAPMPIHSVPPRFAAQPPPAPSMPPQPSYSPTQQMQQIQQMPLPMPTSGLPGDNMDYLAEQLRIQAQLDNLRLQQESLMARWGDSAGGGQANQPALGLTMGPPPPSNHSPPSSRAPLPATGPNAAAGHRRAQSQAQTPTSAGFGSFGSMGSFGVPAGASAIPPPSAFAAPGGPKPNGHGRRHSVNVVGKAGPSPALPNAMSPNMAFSPPQTFGGPGNAGFQFPPPGPGQAPPSQAQLPQPPAHHQQLPMGVDPGAYGSELDFGASPHGGGGGFVAGHSRRESRGSMGSIVGWGPTSNLISANLANNGPTDLAQATAQLAQLGQYRATAGHSRAPSQGGHQQQQQQQQRKSLFAPYLPPASIPPLLSAGRLVVGTLRVNKRNRSDAYVATDVLESDIYICGSKDRNRALEGDVVAVELLDVDDVWSTKKEKEDKKRKKEESTAYDPRAVQAVRRQDKKNDDVEVEGQGLTLFEDEEVSDEQKPHYAGHVVAVISRVPGQLFTGMLGVLRPSSAATKEKQEAERRERDGPNSAASPSHVPPPKIVWFRPTDKRVPLAAIPVSEAPDDFLSEPDKYQNTLFVAAIKRWPITSLHPFGTLVDELGPVGDLEVETSALLKDAGFNIEDFGEQAAKCLPPVPWSIPEHEIANRRDLREERVFTIDPITAKDLDDALHVRQLDDGNVEVGVHIADVSHFVKPNTALDREARKRATTVYLVQRAYPMLPPVLSESLCSLTPGEDKLTFSAIFTLTPDGRVQSTWYGRTVIRSCAQLAYDQAQEAIEGRSLPDKIKLAEDTPHSPVGIAEDIVRLASIARHLRRRRFEGGALRIDNVKLNFHLGVDGIPHDCSVYERKESHSLIEEFMLLANTAVAQRIAVAMPEQAFLRRHEPPIERRLDGFVRRARDLGILMDSSSAGALQRSFDDVADPHSRLVLQVLSTKAMIRAKYFCAGSVDIAKYHHYALNVPLYTHFTSPIRRYADVIVHRQLEAALASPEPRFYLDTEGVAQAAAQCTTKKDAARHAQDASQHLYLCAFLNDLTIKYGPVIREAKVIGVFDQSFDVLVPDFGIEKRIHVEQIPIDNHVHDAHSNTLSLYWKQGVDVLSWLADTSGEPHQLFMRRIADHHAALRSGAALASTADDPSLSGLPKALPNEAASPSSSQHRKSLSRTEPKFNETTTTKAGHRVQVIRELQTIPVICAADITKSPPVVILHAMNPFGTTRA